METMLYLSNVGGWLHLVFFLLSLALYFIGGGHLDCSSMQENEFAEANEEFIDGLCEDNGFRLRAHMVYVQLFGAFNFIAFALCVVPLRLYFTEVHPIITAITSRFEPQEMDKLTDNSRKNLIKDVAKVTVSHWLWKYAYYMHVFCECLTLCITGLICYAGFHLMTFHLEEIAWEYVQLPFFPQYVSCGFKIAQIDASFYGICSISYSYFYEFLYFILIIFYAIGAIKILYDLVYSLMLCSSRMRRNWYLRKISPKADEEELQIMVDDRTYCFLYTWGVFSVVMGPEDFMQLKAAFKNLQKAKKYQ